MHYCADIYTYHAYLNDILQVKFFNANSNIFELGKFELLKEKGREGGWRRDLNGIVYHVNIHISS